MTPQSPHILSSAHALRAVMCLLLLLTSCGPGQPSESLGETHLRETIQDGGQSRLGLVSFVKTDGRTAEVMGTHTYTMMFDAEAEFLTNAMYSLGLPLLGEGNRVTTAEYQQPAPGFSWDAFLGASRGFRPAMKGDRLRLAGEVEFERRESGWVATSTRFRAVHDSTTRDMEAIRRAEERRREEEAERLRQEADRLETMARERDARDAAAERSEFRISGPAEGYPSIYESGSYYIGRLTSSDVLVFRRVSGDLRRIALRLSSETHSHPHAPGDHLSQGDFGGTGASYDIANELRLEMQQAGRFRDSAARHVFVHLQGTGLLEVDVTVLCHQEEGNPPCRGR